MLEEIFIPIVIGKSGINYKIHVLHTRYLLVIFCFLWSCIF